MRLYRGLIEEVRICEASGMHSTRVQNGRYKYRTTDLDQRVDQRDDAARDIKDIKASLTFTFKMQNDVDQ